MGKGVRKGGTSVCGVQVSGDPPRDVPSRRRLDASMMSPLHSFRICLISSKPWPVPSWLSWSTAALDDTRPPSRIYNIVRDT